MIELGTSVAEACRPPARLIANQTGSSNGYAQGSLSGGGVRGLEAVEVVATMNIIHVHV